jgi:signal transduction histidine kinase
MDFGGLILQLKSLFEKNDHQCDASLNFLRGQYSLFTRLSRTLSEFLERHSWSVSMAIHSALERCSEASRIRLQTESDSEQWKFRLLERQLFSEKLFLILENLTNNAFEAGAALVTIRLARLEEELVEIVVEDDGPGLPEHIFKELLANPGYALAGGKSGLVTSRNACESLGGSFLIDCDLKAGCRIRLQLPCFKV